MKCLYMVLSILTSTINQGHSKGIRWLLNTRPAVIGNDIKLLCAVNNNSNSYSVIWEKGNNLIAVDEILADDSKKYSIRKDITGIALIIRKLSYDDVNVSYRCSCGFEYDRHVLDLNDDFEKHPTANSTIINQNNDVNGNLRINVTFTEVYPSPKCKLVLDGIDLSANLNYNSTKPAKHAWFRVSILYLQQSDYNRCQELHVCLECRFGSYTRQIINETSLPPCKKEEVLFTEHLAESHNIEQPLIITACSLFILLGIISIGVFLIVQVLKKLKVKTKECNGISENLLEKQISV